MLALVLFDFCLYGAQGLDARAVVNGNTVFAFELYGRIKAQPGNIIFSPFCISSCLAMAYAGARDETATQIARTLHFPTNDGLVQGSFSALRLQLTTVARNGGIELDIANGLWAQANHPFLPAYLGVAKSQYDAEVKQADFKNGADAIARELNQWISDKTKGKIQNMLPSQALNLDDRLLLASAIYFKGRWATAFDKSATSLQPFHVSLTNTIDVPLMRRFDSVRYAESEAFQLIELPYAGNTFAMLVLLPKKVDGLAQLEGWLSSNFLSGWLPQLKMRQVEIFLPNFKLETGFRVGLELTRMGMANAFRQTADFSGIDGTNDLYLSAVDHKAMVEVNEDGTVAAAATSGIAATVSAAQAAPPPVFRADHPFVFLIRDTRSGCLLFLGRLVGAQ